MDETWQQQQLRADPEAYEALVEEQMAARLQKTSNAGPEAFATAEQTDAMLAGLRRCSDPARDSS